MVAIEATHRLPRSLDSSGASPMAHNVQRLATPYRRRRSAALRIRCAAGPERRKPRRRSPHCYLMAPLRVYDTRAANLRRGWAARPAPCPAPIQPVGPTRDVMSRASEMRVWDHRPDFAPVGASSHSQGPVPSRTFEKKGPWGDPRDASHSLNASLAPLDLGLCPGGRPRGARGAQPSGSLRARWTLPHVEAASAVDRGLKSEVPKRTPTTVGRGRGLPLSSC